MIRSESRSACLSWTTTRSSAGGCAAWTKVFRRVGRRVVGHRSRRAKQVAKERNPKVSFGQLVGDRTKPSRLQATAKRQQPLTGPLRAALVLLGNLMDPHNSHHGSYLPHPARRWQWQAGRSSPAGGSGGKYRYAPGN